MYTCTCIFNFWILQAAIELLMTPFLVLVLKTKLSKKSRKKILEFPLEFNLGDQSPTGDYWQLLRGILTIQLRIWGHLFQEKEIFESIWGTLSDCPLSDILGVIGCQKGSKGTFFVLHICFNTHMLIP